MSEEKNNMTPEDIEKKKYVDSWLKKIARAMLGIARRNHYGVVLPELLLSCLMSHDDLKSYYEHAFERVSSSINLSAFIKQLDSYVSQNSMYDKRTRRSSLSPQYNEMQEILQRYLIVFHPALAPSLLPFAIMKMESSIGGDMLRAAGFNADLFFKDAFYMTKKCNDFEEDSEEPQAAPGKQDKIIRSLEEAMQNLREELKKLHEDIPEDDYDGAEMDDSPRHRLRHRKREKESMLKQFAVELVDAAANGKLEPLVGRERELESLITILNQKHANNAIVLGNEALGVSEDTLVEVDGCIGIPMFGEKSSINVGNAAAAIVCSILAAQDVTGE
jgi:ATP-dependent Clp protease ATP-binding subunit ClpA